MKQSEVIEMAKQAGIEEAYSLKHNQYLVQFKDGSPEVFAKLIAEKEREACAKVCDELPAPDEYSITDKSIWDVTCIDCADAIRARGNA